MSKLLSSGFRPVKLHELKCGDVFCDKAGHVFKATSYYMIEKTDPFYARCIGCLDPKTYNFKAGFIGQLFVIKDEEIFLIPKGNSLSPNVGREILSPTDLEVIKAIKQLVDRKALNWCPSADLNFQNLNWLSVGGRQLRMITNIRFTIWDAVRVQGLG